MRDFIAFLPKEQLETWKARETTHKKMGGIVIAAQFTASIPDEFSELLCFPQYWKTDVTPYQMQIGDFTVPATMSEQSFIQFLTTLQYIDQDLSVYQIPTTDYYSIGPAWIGIREGVELTAPGNAQTVELRLAFLEIGMAEFLSMADEAYYYKIGSDNQYYARENDEGSAIYKFLRGIAFSRAFTQIPEVTGQTVIGVNTYRSLIAKPFPIPQTNDAGAVAYTINPTCPPYWRSPDAPLDLSIGHMFLPGRFNAFRYGRLPEPEPSNQSSKASNWRNLFLAAIAIIIVLVIAILQKK